MIRKIQSYAITIALLAGTGGVLHLSNRRNPEPLHHPLDSVPAELAGWKWDQNDRIDSTILTGLKPSSYLARTYQKQGRRLGIFIAYYSVQRAGESIHSPKHCLPGSGWEISQQSWLTIPLHGEQATVNNYSIRKADEVVRMLYWYQSRKRVFASEYLGKLFLLRDCMLEGRTEGALVRITLPNTEDLTDEGRAVAQKLIPSLQWCLGG